MLINDTIQISEKAFAELELLEELLERELSQGNAFISGEALRLLRSGGKRLRPLLTILFSGLGGTYDRDTTLRAAASIETMHMATLVHDDTIDNAEQRRGIDTTFKKHGIHTAVYTGDWMLLRSLKILSPEKTESNKLKGLLDILSDGLEMVCNGEIDQYYGRGRIPSKNEYFSRIKGKTASMFGAAAMIGAKAGELPDILVKLAYDFGMAFGIAFQIRDDIIDMGNTGVIAGKPVKNDLREGIITLPVLLACENSTAFRHKLERFLKDPSGSSESEIVHEAAENGGITSAEHECSKYVSACLSYLKKIPAMYKTNEIHDLVGSVFS